jgi:enoyl-[acyl-carrier-protein] reductase (NADH)
LLLNPYSKILNTNPVLDVPGMTEFILSENAAWITGEIIRVDGGEQIIGL